MTIVSFCSLFFLSDKMLIQRYNGWKDYHGPNLPPAYWL